MKSRREKKPETVLVSGGELLVDLLQACGVGDIFGSPGAEWAAVREALLKRPGGPRFLICRHDMLAVSLAQGYAEGNGKLPAVFVNGYTGALHGATAIRNARVAGVPLLIFGGPAAMTEGFTRWSNSVTSRDGLVDAVVRGSRIARTGGPVFIGVPNELLRQTGEPVRIRSPRPPTVPTPEHEDVLEAAGYLAGSQRPVIIAGNAGKQPGAVKQLVELAELLNSPAFESGQPRASNFPKEHPLYLGYNAAEALEDADAVLVAGEPTPWYPPQAGPPADTRVIILDSDTRHENLPYWGYDADTYVTGDVEKSLEELTGAVREILARQVDITPPREKVGPWQTLHDELLAQWKAEGRAGNRKRPIDAAWFLYTAAEIFPPEAVILDETLEPAPLVHRYLARPGGYIKAAFGGPGVGLGEAAGFKLAQPGRPVILLAGDVAFNYNPVPAGLGLCQEYDIPLFIIILNNDGYRSMGDDISPAPDYGKIAEAFGAYADKLTEPEDVEPGLRWGLEHVASGKTVLLDVVLEPAPPMMPPQKVNED